MEMLIKCALPGKVNLCPICISVYLPPNYWLTQKLHGSIKSYLAKAMRARTLSFRCVKKTGRSEHRNDYKKKRNKVANMIKSANQGTLNS
jgi:hypothetical protein